MKLSKKNKLRKNSKRIKLNRNIIKMGGSRKKYSIGRPPIFFNEKSKRRNTNVATNIKNDNLYNGRQLQNVSPNIKNLGNNLINGIRRFAITNSSSAARFNQVSPEFHKSKENFIKSSLSYLESISNNFSELSRFPFFNEMLIYSEYIFEGRSVSSHITRLIIPTVIQQIIILNPWTTEELLKRSLFFNPDDSIKNWDLSKLNLEQLPELFGYLHISRDLYLHNNQLSSLPESFGSLTVGRNLWLNFNNLSSLPESFASITVGGNLGFAYNNLKSLPESFGSITVGGHLFLDDNNLTSLPNSFGSLTVGGNLVLSNNNFHQDIPELPNVSGEVILHEL